MPRSASSRSRRRTYRSKRNAYGKRVLSCCLLLCCWSGSNGVAGGCIFREHDVHFAAGFVLYDDERSADLSVRAELQFAAGQQRILQINLLERIADGSLVQAAGLLDGGRESTHSFIG